MALSGLVDSSVWGFSRRWSLQGHCIAHGVHGHSTAHATVDDALSTSILIKVWPPVSENRSSRGRIHSFSEAGVRETAC